MMREQNLHFLLFDFNITISTKTPQIKPKIYLSYTLDLSRFFIFGIVNSLGAKVGLACLPRTHGSQVLKVTLLDFWTSLL